MSEDPFGSGGALDGCIRIGERVKSKKPGGGMYPSKLDYFIATRPHNKEADSAPRHEAMNKVLAELHGERPQRITVILGGHKPEDVFRCGFAFWPGKTCACITENFKTAKQTLNGVSKEIECNRKTCPNIAQDASPKCKPFGILNFRFEHAPRSGGYWRFTTHSWHSVRKLRDNLKSLYEYTKDLNGLEVELELEFETAVVKGQQTRIPTVRLSSHCSPAELAAGLGRKFVSPAKVEIALPVIKTSAKEVENSLQENSDALGLKSPPPSYDTLSEDDFL